MKKVTVGTFTATERMRELVNEVLNTGRISYGPMSREFERKFASIHESQFGILSNSGTSSLLVALQAMKELYGWRDGTEVIVPSVTFVATINIVLHCRMKPVIVDVEPDCYGMDPGLLHRAITDQTKAIIPVHLFGMPCDMTAISEIADLYSLRIIEDSCESMFVRHAGRISWGDIGCFSTYVAHLITTGVGGISTTDNEDLAIRMRSLVNHGRDKVYISIDDDDNLSEARLKEVIGKRLRFGSVGHSFRITELEAALGLAQLETWQEMIRKRQGNAQYLTVKLSAYPQLQLPTIRDNTGHAFMMYPIVVREGGKWGLVHHLEANGIETRDMLPVTNQPVYQDWLNEDDYPVAKWINQGGLYLGCHQDLTVEDLDWIIYQVDRFYS